MAEESHIVNPLKNRITLFCAQNTQPSHAQCLFLLSYFNLNHLLFSTHSRLMLLHLMLISDRSIECERFLLNLRFLFCGYSKTGNTKKTLKSSETFEQKLARSDPDFLKFLKGEKSDLLEFDDGDLSEESDEEQNVPKQAMDDVHEIKKKKKMKVKNH